MRKKEMTKQLRQAVVQKGDQFGTVVLCIADEINGFGQFVPTLKSRSGSAHSKHPLRPATSTKPPSGSSTISVGPLFSMVRRTTLNSHDTVPKPFHFLGEILVSVISTSVPDSFSF